MTQAIRIMQAPDGAFEAWVGDRRPGDAAEYVHIRTIMLNAKKGDVIYPFINGLDRRLVVTDGPLLY